MTVLQEVAAILLRIANGRPTSAAEQELNLQTRTLVTEYVLKRRITERDAERVDSSERARWGSSK